MYILRIKAVSECMRIRRASVCYLMDRNQKVDSSKLPHPLRKFKNITIENGNILVEDKKENLKVGEEVFFYKMNSVDTGNGTETERCAMGAMLIPVSEELASEFEKGIQANATFDQWNGEYEYILGMYYEYEKKDDAMAKEWYQKAIDKRFMFRMVEE